jgi:hypothetical protein
MKRMLAARGATPEQIEAIRLELDSGHDAESRLNAVRGWLLLFVVMVGANSAVAFAIGAVTSLVGSGFDRAHGVAQLLLGAYGAYAAYLLGRVRPAALLHARCWLIAVAAVSLLAVVLDPSVREVPSGTGRPLLFAIIWLIYLAHSKRVATVYAPRTDQRARLLT